MVYVLLVCVQMANGASWCNKRPEQLRVMQTVEECRAFRTEVARQMPQFTAHGPNASYELRCLGVPVPAFVD